MNFNIHLASVLYGKDHDNRSIDFKGNDPKQVISPDPIMVRFDYPLSQEFVFACTGPVTVEGFVTFVAKTYERIYQEEDASTTVKAGQAPGLLNRNATNGLYGIWGHGLGDLYLEGARLDKNGVWDLEMGS